MDPYSVLSPPRSAPDLRDRRVLKGAATCGPARERAVWRIRDHHENSPNGARRAARSPTSRNGERSIRLAPFSNCDADCDGQINPVGSCDLTVPSVLRNSSHQAEP